MNVKRLWTSSIFLLAISLALSIFTYLWNPLQFPAVGYDDGAYIGRGMYLLITQSPQEGKSYDHPYFGQLFLGFSLGMTGYPSSLHPSAEGDVVHSIKMLWLVPKILIGVIGVIDTFLVYKISERRYNTKVAFIAAILFAVTSMIFLRTVFLESLQLPFLLMSILFAVYSKDRKNNSDTRIVSMTLLSGIFLGLAIFTKIPVLAMIPLVAFVIFTNNNRNIKMVGFWLIPVILIPLVWPAYAIIHGEFAEWLDAVYWQTHRQSTSNLRFENQLTLLNAIAIDFLKMPILVAIGFVGLIFATIKKDFFLLLWVIPFLIFLYFLGFVRDFHLIPLLPAACISGARLIEGVSNMFNNKKVRVILPFFVISAIAIFGLVNFIILSSTNNNEETFAETALVIRYLQDDKNNNLTMISTPVYSWIPKYVFQLDGEYLEPDPANGLEVNQTERVLMVVDRVFKFDLSGNDTIGEDLRKIYGEHNKNGTTVVEDSRNKIILPQPWPSGLEQDHGINLIDKEHVWKSNGNIRISQSDSDLNVVFTTNKTEQKPSSALLETQLKNLTERPLLLSLDYASKSSNSNTRYFVEIRDSDDQNKRYFKRNVMDTAGNLTKNLFILPGEIVEKELTFRLGINANSSGEHEFTIKRAKVISNISN
ncbi:MAG TPA: glycosyltransferase family 39 protein [Nitrososphaeraceae archaeon]|nr:glycosyltransferase family 39 protein [Nitrososphaeraceae archaeon]